MSNQFEFVGSLFEQRDQAQAAIAGGQLRGIDAKPLWQWAVLYIRWQFEYDHGMNPIFAPSQTPIIFEKATTMPPSTVPMALKQ